MTMEIRSYTDPSPGTMPRVRRSTDQWIPPTEPVTKPQQGDEYQPRGQHSVSRKLGDRYQVTGVEHCTSDQDLQSMYLAVHLAMRHALRVHHQQREESRQGGGDIVQLRLVEVGSWCGESAVTMAIAVEDAVAVSRYKAVCALYLVDHFTGTLGEQSEILARGYSGSTLDYCLDNVSQLAYRAPGKVDFNVRIRAGDSVEMAKDIEPVDYVFIDADHTYEGCKGDIEAWWPHLKPGSIMAGHDYGLLFPDVIVAADECCQRLAGCNPLVPEGSTCWMVRKPLEDA